MAKARARNRLTAAVLFAVAGGMVGLAFASVPLYRLFCQVTGYGGTPKIGAAPVAATPAQQPAPTITVRFDANVNRELPWRFRPERAEMTVRAGEPALAFYRAENRSADPIVGTATFNVTPYKAAGYFSKIDCFCFTEQRLAAGEEAALGVQFFVDPAIFTDPDTRDVTAITLSYTFFRAPGAERRSDEAARTTAPADARPAPG